jgi:hypothetical protein
MLLITVINSKGTEGNMGALSIWMSNACRLHTRKILLLLFCCRLVKEVQYIEASRQAPPQRVMKMSDTGARAMESEQRPSGRLQYIM